MKVIILTPEKTLYEGEAISLLFSILGNSFQLLEHHANIIVLLKEGNSLFQFEKEIFLLEVFNDVVKILVNS